MIGILTDDKFASSYWGHSLHFLDWNSSTEAHLHACCNYGSRIAWQVEDMIFERFLLFRTSRRRYLRCWAIVTLSIIFVCGTPLSSGLSSGQSQDSSCRVEFLPFGFPRQHIRMKIHDLLGAKGPVIVEITPGLSGEISGRVCTFGVKPKSCYVSRDDPFIHDAVFSVESVEIMLGRRALWIMTRLDFCYGGKRTIPWLLAMNAKGRLINLLEDLEGEPEDEWKLWRDPAVSLYLLMTTTKADWIDKYHQYRYEIRTYEYCPQTMDYVEADTVWPARTLPRDDPRHRKNFLINRTMPVIKARLLRRKSKCITSIGKLPSHMNRPHGSRIALNI